MPKDPVLTAQIPGPPWPLHPLGEEVGPQPQRKMTHVMGEAL